MLAAPLEQIERRAASAARRAAFGGAAMLCLIVGVAFLTVAAWLFLSMQGGALFAAGVIGAAYAGLGLILAALAMRGRTSYVAPPPEMPAHIAVIHLADGFAAGLNAGRAARAP